MYQPDLFAAGTFAKPTERPARTPELDVPAILDRLTAACERPRYNFMVLNLIAQASARTGSAGPYVREGDRRIPIRDWLCDAMAPVARRDPRRLALADKIRAELVAAGQLPLDADEAGSGDSGGRSSTHPQVGQDERKPRGLRARPGRVRPPPLSGVPRRPS